MILLDVNLLVYAYDETSKHHPQARTWWENQLNGSQMIGLSWVALLGFIRLLTNPRIYADQKGIGGRRQSGLSHRK